MIGTKWEFRWRLADSCVNEQQKNEVFQGS